MPLQPSRHIIGPVSRQRKAHRRTNTPSYSERAGVQADTSPSILKSKTIYMN